MQEWALIIAFVSTRIVGEKRERKRERERGRESGQQGLRETTQADHQVGRWTHEGREREEGAVGERRRGGEAGSASTDAGLFRGRSGHKAAPFPSHYLAYLPTLPAYLAYLPTCLLSYYPTCLPCLPTLPTCLLTYLPTLPTSLPAYLAY